MALLLGIDLGTSYFKVGLFDAAGTLRGLGRVAVPLTAPDNGRCELPVDAFWASLRQGLIEALAEAGAVPADIAGISYSSQANTFLLLDERNAPLTPLVIWKDRRAHPVETAVREFGASDAFQRTTGFAGLTPEFAPAKWRWFQREEPVLWSRVRRVMTLSDYLTFALTGEVAGDASTAAFTGMLDVTRGQWWPEALAFAGVSAAQLSAPLPPGTPCGRTIAAAGALLGLPAGIPFAVGALDHHAAAIGSGVGRLGEASISTGTVLAALTLVPAVEPVPDCYHGPHLDPRQFYRLAFDPEGAGQLEDYQRSSAPHLDIARLATLAGDAPPGLTRAEMAALSGDRRHGAEVRRMMERISASHRHLLGQVSGGRPITRVIATGGGARSAVWLQINADMLGLPIVAPLVPERACLGAAAFAAAAAGIDRDVATALSRMVQSDRVMLPRPAAVALYRDWREA